MDIERPRICYVSDERFPSRWTDTQQIMKTAASLASRGMDVDVVLPRKWPGTLLRGNAARKRILERAYGIRATFDLTQIPSVPPSRVRAEKIAHGLLAPAWAIWSGHDVIYTRNVMPLVLGLVLGKYAVFESHRILRLHYPVVYRWIRMFRDHPRFLGVVTNADMVADSYAEMGFARERIAVVHNAFDPADMAPRLSRAQARQLLGLPAEGGIVCYAGHIQKRKGIALVTEIAARTPELRYLICGGYPRDVEAARNLAQQASAHNMTFYGWVGVHKLAPYLYAADVLLIPPAAAPLARYGNTLMPIKTYTYLAAGRVIVAPRLVDTAQILEHEENALLVPPDDREAATAAIRRAVAEPELAERLGAAAQALSAKFTWDARASQIEAFIAGRLRAVGAS